MRSKIDTEKNEGKTLEASRHLDELQKLDELSSGALEYATKLEESINDLEERYSISKDSQDWKTAREAVKRINEASPHQPIDAPKAILEMSKEEMELFFPGEPFSYARYIPFADVLLVERGLSIPAGTIAHELGHKQQCMYDRLDVSNIDSVDSLLSEIKNKKFLDETRADLAGAKVFPEKGNALDFDISFIKKNAKADIEKAISEIGLTEFVKSAPEILHSNGISKEEIKHLDDTLINKGVEAFKKELAELTVNFPDETHPPLEERRFISQRQIDTGLLKTLAYDEQKVIQRWKDEFRQQQPPALTNDQIMDRALLSSVNIDFTPLSLTEQTTNLAIQNNNASSSPRR